MAARGPNSRRFELPAESFTKCPAGHTLPHEIDGLECSTAACAQGARDAITPPVSGNNRSEEQQIDLEARRIAIRERLRQKLVPVPTGLEGAAADEYVERKITELQPTAIAEMEWQVRFGSDGERYKAAKDILDAGGHGKKDRIGAAANMIVINMGPGGAPPPLPYVGEIVEAATKALKP